MSACGLQNKLCTAFTCLRLRNTEGRERMRMNGQIVYGWMDGRMYGGMTGRQTNGQMDRWMNRCNLNGRRKGRRRRGGRIEGEKGGK